MKLIKEVLENSKVSDIEDEWVNLAKVLDRLCFVAFLITFAVTTFVMLLPGYLTLYEVSAKTTDNAH